MQSQEDLRKHQYKQSSWRWWDSSGAISNPKRWCCESVPLNMPANLENSAVAIGLEKVSSHSNLGIGNAKECSNYRTIALISHTSKVMLKILQARLQQYMNCEIPDIQAGFIKGRWTRDQITNTHCITEKAREFQKNIYFYFIDYTKTLTVWITTNYGKFFKRWEYQTTLPASWEICMQVKKQQLDQTWNNRLVPNWERNTSRQYIITLLI